MQAISEFSMRVFFLPSRTSGDAETRQLSNSVFSAASAPSYLAFDFGFLRVSVCLW